MFLCSPAFAADEIKVGSINDLTGATSDVGKDAALGIRECVTYINDQGGINGKKIKLLLYDYGYRVPEAITIYKRFRDTDKIALLLQWGTGDTEALSPTVNKDKMVTISDSLSGHLCDPAKTPYNFIYSTDYSTNARAALTAWYEEGLEKERQVEESQRSRSKTQAGLLLHVCLSLCQRSDQGHQRPGCIARDRSGQGPGRLLDGSGRQEPGAWRPRVKMRQSAGTAIRPCRSRPPSRTLTL